MPLMATYTLISEQLDDALYIGLHELHMQGTRVVLSLTKQDQEHQK